MSSYEPGSRAITIPLHPNSLRTATTRQTRSKFLARTDSSEAGPSSLSSRDSSWSSPQNSADSVRHNPLRKPVHRPSVSPALDLLDREPPQDLSAKRKDKQTERHPHAPHTPSTSPPSELPSAASTAVHGGTVHNSPLGPSMIASSSYKSINLSSSRSDPDEPPRLITYTKYSQGFTWNDELFLPGYLLGRYGGGGAGRRRRQRWGMDDDEDADEVEGWGMTDSNDPERCPVTEIFVTDEEADAMMP